MRQDYCRTVYLVWKQQNSGKRSHGKSLPTNIASFFIRRRSSNWLLWIYCSTTQFILEDCRHADLYMLALRVITASACCLRWFFSVAHWDGPDIVTRHTIPNVRRQVLPLSAYWTQGAGVPALPHCSLILYTTYEIYTSCISGCMKESKRCSNDPNERN